MLNKTSIIEKKISDLKVWVSGGSRGIGLETARKFVEAGATVFLTSRNKKNILKYAPELENHANVFMYDCDIRLASSIEVAFSSILKIGVPDVLINNAGVAKFGPLMSFSDEKFDDVVSTNFKGVFLITKAVVSAMIENGGGMILFINSVSSNTPFANSSIYAASKAATLLMSQCLRMEVRDKNIKVVNVIPGATNTEIWRDDIRKLHGDRMMDPSDVAEVVFSSVELCLRDKLVIEEIVVRPKLGDL